MQNINKKNFVTRTYGGNSSKTILRKVCFGENTRWLQEGRNVASEYLRDNESTHETWLQRRVYHRDYNSSTVKT